MTTDPARDERETCWPATVLALNSGALPPFRGAAMAKEAKKSRCRSTSRL